MVAGHYFKRKYRRGSLKGKGEGKLIGRENKSSMRETCCTTKNKQRKRLYRVKKLDGRYNILW